MNRELDREAIENRDFTGAQDMRNVELAAWQLHASLALLQEIGNRREVIARQMERALQAGQVLSERLAEVHQAMRVRTELTKSEGRHHG